MHARPLLSALALCLAVAACDKTPERPRRQQTVKLLPDAPPPPPPKIEERPPPRKAEDKPQPQNVPKPADAPPQPQALKSDEAAGNGPGNGLGAGPVTQDYTDQKLGTASVGGAEGDGPNRLAATAFANATTRALNEHLQRDKAIKQRDYRVRVALWLSAAGGLQRVELSDSTGDAEVDQALRAALTRFPGSTSPPPPRLPQPLRLLVSNRLMG